MLITEIILAKFKAKSSSRKLKEVQKKLQDSQGVLHQLEVTANLDPTYFSSQRERQRHVQSETLDNNVVDLRVKLGRLIEQQESLNVAL